MILVDSSVWIDFFRGGAGPEIEALERFVRDDEVVVGDLVLTEVLQGFSSERDFRRAHAKLSAFDVVEIAGVEVAVQAARHYRALRARGVTVRKTIDTLIATRCLMDGLVLLYTDRDFDPFVQHLGLKRVD